VRAGAATELAAERGEPFDPQAEIDAVGLQINAFETPCNVTLYADQLAVVGSVRVVLPGLSELNALGLIRDARYRSGA
jgi:hypothetical protein